MKNNKKPWAIKTYKNETGWTEVVRCADFAEAVAWIDRAVADNRFGRSDLVVEHD